MDLGFRNSSFLKFAFANFGAVRFGFCELWFWEWRLAPLGAPPFLVYNPGPARVFFAGSGSMCRGFRGNFGFANFGTI